MSTIRAAVQQSVEGEEAKDAAGAVKVEARPDSRNATSAPPEGQRQRRSARNAAAAAAASALDEEADDEEDGMYT